jgi:hypothetical protein
MAREPPDEPSLSVTQSPDSTTRVAADRAVGKGTIVVRLGPRVAVRIAIVLFIVPYAILQVVVLERYVGRRCEPGRIDGLMAMALTYILWFVAIPLWGLV